MNKKLKLALAALLGFSAACSTVKNAPAKGEPAAAGEADTTVMETPRMVVMYGVRIPRKGSPEGAMSVPLKDSVDRSGNTVAPPLDPLAEEAVEE
ncbi:hypothetical protein [Alistipes sp.]|uniref:hypothetical protein n=1 Tax=Alistipes sp. TaxID=1872444 RepID=UPI003AF0B8D7